MFRREIPGGWHARARSKADHRDRAHRPLSLQPNPIYLAFSLFQLGVAIWLNSLWLLATLVVAVTLVHFIVIRREENYLERRFGAEYLDYKAAVRRWL